MDVLNAIFSPPVKQEGRSFFDMFGGFTFNGYPLVGLPQSIRGDREEIPNTFDGYIDGALKGSAVIYTLVSVRLQVFSQARIVYRRLDRGRPGELFTTPNLNMVNRPSPGKTVADLLARALLDVDMAGNHFAAKRNGKVKRLRPDWVTVVLGSTESGIDPVHDPDAEVVGYMYHPQGNMNTEPVWYEAGEVAHWAPTPDPIANYRGMSWITPCIPELVAAKQAIAHKQKFFENGATPNLIIKHQIENVDTLKKWIELYNQRHTGVENAYKTLHLGAGADPTVVGTNFQEMDFKNISGAAESIIAAASGVGAVVAQFSEGMQGSSLNAGNYSAARRRVSDIMFRHLWSSFCAAYEQIVTVPSNAELWYDDRDIAFLREDESDASAIQFRRAQTIRTLTDSGWEAESVKAAVDSDDMTLLEHTGLFSVQLQKPGAVPTADNTAPTEEPSDE